MEIRVGIEGMRCGMCESHVNDKIRKSFNIKKVKSSHKKNETIIKTEEDININDLKKIIEEMGYKVISINKQNFNY